MAIFIEINGKRFPISKQALFDGAKSGKFNRDTKIWVDGRESTLGKVKGVEFKQVADDLYKIAETNTETVLESKPVSLPPFDKKMKPVFNKDYYELKEQMSNARATKIKIFIYSFALLCVIAGIVSPILVSSHNKKMEEFKSNINYGSDSNPALESLEEKERGSKAYYTHDEMFTNKESVYQNVVFINPTGREKILFPVYKKESDEVLCRSVTFPDNLCIHGFLYTPEIEKNWIEKFDRDRFRMFGDERRVADGDNEAADRLNAYFEGE